MKLTKSMGSAFVNAVLRDLPSEAEEIKSKMRKLVEEVAVEAMPPKVKAAYKSNPGWIKTGNCHFPGVPDAFYSIPGECTPSMLRESGRFDELMALSDALKTSKNGLSDLRRRLMATTEACKTVRQLRETLPELAKYLPDGMQRIKSLPTVTGLVEDLQKSGLRLGDNKGAKK